MIIPNLEKRVQSLCAFADPVPPGINSGLWKLVNEMTQDDISATIKSGKCIIHMGQNLYNRVGSDVGKHEYICQI